MSVRVQRWLECDFGFCNAKFTQGRQQDAMATTGNKKLTLREAAALANWSHDDGVDLCAYHTEQATPDVAAPALFAVPDLDHRV